MADYNIRDMKIGTGQQAALNDTRPAAIQVDIISGGDSTTGSVGRLFIGKNAGTNVAVLTKAGALALASLLAIGSAAFANTAPALKANGTSLQVRLADDSALTDLESKSITLTGGTITTNATGLTLTQTWNAGGVTFTGMLINVTNTASAAASRLLDVQIGGVSYFSVGPTGIANVSLIGWASTAYLTRVTGALLGVSASSTGTNPGSGFGPTHGVRNVSGNTVNWTDNASSIGAGTIDTGIGRNAAGILEVNNGTLGTYRDLLARNVRMNPVTVASLVAAATAGNGALCVVTDANATTPRSTVAGGGSNKVLVMSDGTNWIIV